MIVIATMTVTITDPDLVCKYQWPPSGFGGLIR